MGKIFRTDLGAAYYSYVNSNGISFSSQNTVEVVKCATTNARNTQTLDIKSFAIEYCGLKKNCIFRPAKLEMEKKMTPILSFMLQCMQAAQSVAVH